MWFCLDAEAPPRYLRYLVRPKGPHLFLQFLLFAAAATFAVAIGVWLHGLESSGGGARAYGAVATLPEVRDSGVNAVRKALVAQPGDIAAMPVIRRAIPIGSASAAELALASLKSPETVLPPAPLEDGGLTAALGTEPRVPYVYQAVVMQDLDWLGKLLKAGFPIDAVSPSGDTALCTALNLGSTAAVELLLAHKADPNKPGKEGQPPIALASLRRTDGILAALLKAGAEANAVFVKPVPEALLAGISNRELRSSLRTDTGVTPLMAVAARGDVEGTLDLLQHGAKPNQPTRKYFRYPINFAAEQRYVFLMRLLLGRPADSEPDILVTVDLSQQKAYLQQYGQVIDRTSISTGREGYDTPQGRYVVTDKHKTWTSTIYKVSMPYFMRLNCGAIGLHAGYVTGQPASHGCIRLPSDKARKWFAMVKVGDEVQIVR